MHVKVKECDTYVREGKGEQFLWAFSSPFSHHQNSPPTLVATVSLALVGFLFVNSQLFELQSECGKEAHYTVHHPPPKPVLRHAVMEKMYGISTRERSVASTQASKQGKKEIPKKKKTPSGRTL